MANSYCVIPIICDLTTVLVLVKVEVDNNTTGNFGVKTYSYSFHLGTASCVSPMDSFNHDLSCFVEQGLLESQDAHEDES